MVCWAKRGRTGHAKASRMHNTDAVMDFWLSAKKRRIWEYILCADFRRLNPFDPVIELYNGFMDWLFKISYVYILEIISKFV